MFLQQSRCIDINAHFETFSCGKMIKTVNSSVSGSFVSTFKMFMNNAG